MGSVEVESTTAMPPPPPPSPNRPPPHSHPPLVIINIHIFTITQMNLLAVAVIFCHFSGSSNFYLLPHKPKHRFESVIVENDHYLSLLELEWRWRWSGVDTPLFPYTWSGQQQQRQVKHETRWILAKFLQVLLCPPFLHSTTLLIFMILMGLLFVMYD